MPPLVYFPNSRVASDGELVSPQSHASADLAATQNDASAGFVPRGGESPWIVPVQSDEQGLGRSPGQQWPGRVHSEAYNLDQLDIMPFENEQTSGFPDVANWEGRNPPVRQGWSMPVYYEEFQGAGFDPGVAVLEDAQSAAFTMGLPAVETDPGGLVR